MSRGQGMNFVRKDLRIALYLRDGLACCYCGAKLTLDHVIPHSHRGSDKADNLVTACHKCNSSRSDRPIEMFAATVAAYLNHDVTVAQILAHIAACLARPVDRAFAKEVLARRGGFTATMQAHCV